MIEHLFSLFSPSVFAQSSVPCSDLIVQKNALGFIIPSFGEILTFVIRFFFTIAGIIALFYMLLGALSWVTSGGSKEGVDKARDKIQAAVVGVILIVVVLAVIWTLEQVVFNGKICFGISCPATIPSLLPGGPPPTPNCIPTTPTVTPIPATLAPGLATPTATPSGALGGYNTIDSVTTVPGR